MKRTRPNQDETAATTRTADNNVATPDLNEPNQTKPTTPNNSSKKRKLQFGQSPNLVGPQYTRIFEHFRDLDPSNPVEAKRITTRQKQILKGKNTIGYDEYTRQVPKENRKKIIEHPSTPNYKADIPNRRWLGLVKAWRISLHRYDPKDLQSDLCPSDSKAGDKNKSHVKEIIPLQPKPQNVKDQQIAEASSKGLKVDFDDSRSQENNPTTFTFTAPSISANQSNMTVDMNMNDSPVNESTENTIHSNDDVDVDELDKWAAERGDIYSEDELLCYDDSDDDLL